ncbi:MAG: mandelate racemase/muconate lactonizing enzyme family protein [Alphaproteobacteria bacterium]
MPRIRDIRLIPLAFTMDAVKAYGMARGKTARREATLVEVETEDGVVGIGEAFGPPKVTAAYLDLIKDAFIGRRLYERELIWSDIIARRYHLGLQNQMTACYSGINIACYDAIGRTLGVSVADLLGGRGKDVIPAYASDGYITDNPSGKLPTQLEAIAEAGFHAAKIKIGLGPALDQARCMLTREVLGDDVLILVDANGNYGVDLALESMARIKDVGIHLYEEPLPPQDVAGYQALSRRATIPVAAGEALYTIHDFARLVYPRSVDILQPDLTLCGGFDQAKAIASLCQIHNLRYSPHCWGGAVGLAAALHFLSALPDYPHSDFPPYPRLLEYDIGENPLRDELLATPLVPVDGEIAVPAGPGLGIKLNPEAVDRYRIDR